MDDRVDAMVRHDLGDGCTHVVADETKLVGREGRLPEVGADEGVHVWIVDQRPGQGGPDIAGHPGNKDIFHS